MTNTNETWKYRLQDRKHNWKQYLDLQEADLELFIQSEIDLAEESGAKKQRDILVKRIKTINPVYQGRNNHTREIGGNEMRQIILQDLLKQ